MVNPDTKRFQTPQIVEEHRLRPRVLLAALFLAALLAVAWYAFQYGRERAGYDVGDAQSTQQALRGQVAGLEQDRDALRLKMASLEREAQIERAAAKAAQNDIKALHDDKAALRREVAFLKRLLSEGGSEFLVEEFELRANEASNSFQFRFMVTRREKGKKAVKGDVRIRVEGQLKGKAVELSLDRLTAKKTKALKMSFKHYQRFEGNIELPVGFIPKTVVIDVTPSGKKAKRLSRPFDWKLTVG